MEIIAFIEKSENNYYQISSDDELFGCCFGGYGNSLEEAKADFLLSIEEVKQLNKALAPVEEKYQAAVRAKEELKSALKQAGVDFLNAVGIK